MPEKMFFKIRNVKRDFTDEEMNEIFDLAWNGIEVESDENAPMPWDADFIIEERLLILSGGVGPSGFGSCVCEVPTSEADYVYTFSVDPRDIQAEKKLKATIIGIGAEIVT